MDTMQAYGFHPEVAVLGFNQPEPGGRHFYARYAEHTLTIPNNSELSIPQLKMLLRQVEKILERKISLGEWQKL